VKRWGTFQSHGGLTLMPFSNPSGYSRPRHAWMPLLSLLVAILSLGCGEQLGCEAIGAPQGPMFSVMVREDATGNPAWWEATATITDGAFTEELVAPSTTPSDSVEAWPLSSRGSRLGVYTLTVERPGFAVWRVAGQEIRHSGCFVTSLSLEARLERLP
jgi:hypothetical protein